MGFNMAPVYYHTFKLRFWFWVCVLARVFLAYIILNKIMLTKKAIVLIAVRRVISWANHPVYLHPCSRQEV